MISARLYVPADWAGDTRRRRAARVPGGLEFKTKPQLACEILDEITAEGRFPPWVTGDEVYGGMRGCTPPSRPAAPATCEDPLLVPRHAAHRAEDAR